MKQLVRDNVSELQQKIANQLIIELRLNGINTNRFILGTETANLLENYLIIVV